MTEFKGDENYAIVAHANEMHELLSDIYRYHLYDLAVDDVAARVLGRIKDLLEKIGVVINEGEDDGGWKDIETYDKSDPWDCSLVYLKDDNGNEDVGKWAFHEESFDDVYFHWHGEDNEYLGFEPTKWKER